ncbi:MAG: hypothetical protein FGM16_07160 [Flavobacterium sp.]|jgi:hypothetical protein|nr:hypothetical protein [Flavobacterium sp.]
MMNFIVKTHKTGTIYNKPCFYILNKGINSGKPQYEPYTNSFVVLFENIEVCENHYWIAYSLWKTKFWTKHLIGSVILFLRLSDFKKEFFPQSKLLMEEHEAHLQHIAALKLLEGKEKQFHENINLINEMRREILIRYIKQKI